MNILETWYQSQVQNKFLEFDAGQVSILQQLDHFINNFNKTCRLLSWVKKPKHYGYYIYGSVGSGKSMIMNELYNVFPTTNKLRIHFHEFMEQIHQQLSQLKSVDNPLTEVAKNLNQQYQIIFLDEMTVNDIASAMILKNLFTALFDNGIYIVTTSNNHPKELYPNGLMRERFIPAIELLQQKLNILALNGENDYRLRFNSNSKLILINDQESNTELENIFNKINNYLPYNQNNFITILQRDIPYIRMGTNIIWFDFKVICGDKRSQLDYIALVKQFKWFIISDVYSLSDKESDCARRLTWLIDILYDHNCKLSISSSVAIVQIYSAGSLVAEFARTISRLQEMATSEYLNK
jgi:cell division protein ZapE